MAKDTIKTVNIDGTKLFELLKGTGNTFAELKSITGIDPKSFYNYRDNNRIPEYRLPVLKDILGITLDMIKPQEPKPEIPLVMPTVNAELNYDKLSEVVNKAVADALNDFVARDDIQQFMKDVGTLAISSKRRDNKSTYTPRTRRSETLTSPLMKDKLAEIDAEQRELAGKKSKTK